MDGSVLRVEVASRPAMAPVLVEEAVRRIREVCVRSSLEAALRIGAYVLETFFEGDFGAFHARARRDTSFRALARHPELPVSATYLWRAVSVYEQFGALPPEVASALPFSHHQILLCVRSEERRERLAREAVAEGLSKRALEERVRAATRGEDKRSRGGRPRTPALLKAHRQLQSVMRDLPPPALAGEAEMSAQEALVIAGDLERHARLLMRTAESLRSGARASRSG